jgi:amino acid transporter
MQYTEMTSSIPYRMPEILKTKNSKKYITIFFLAVLPIVATIFLYVVLHFSFSKFIVIPTIIISILLFVYFYIIISLLLCKKYYINHKEYGIAYLNNKVLDNIKYFSFIDYSKNYESHIDDQYFNIKLFCFLWPLSFPLYSSYKLIKSFILKIVCKLYTKITNIIINNINPQNDEKE